MCVGVTVNLFLSLDDSNWLWLYLKAIGFLDKHSIGQVPGSIYYIRLKYV